MSLYTITLLDVRGVQHYLFNANELKQNLGASAIIEQVTHDWIVDTLQFLGYRHNIKISSRFIFDFDPELKIEDSTLDAEVIFMGGGNVAILLVDLDHAKAFTREYTTRVLLEAPGLEVAAGHTDVNWDQANSMQAAWKKLREDILPQKKDGFATSQPLLGVGVTSECVFTGLPAVYEHIENGRGTLMSAEAKAKLDHAPTAKERLNFFLQKESFAYPSSFDELGGERGKAQYIAVVHADGNGMGKRIDNYVNNPNNREMLNRLREFSQSINSAGMRAMNAVCDWVATTLDIDEQGNYYLEDRWRPESIIALKDELLPLRPIVFGGDDVTFVCDGRLGLPLAAKLLEAFSKETLSDGKPVYACAGVAVVHTTYPFARAYALAAELAKAAKLEAYRLDKKGKQVSLINWYFASSGLTLNWEEIQKREYQGGNLIIRPLAVEHEPRISVENWRTWGAFTEQIMAFRESPWQGRRAKIKELGNELRKGKNAVERFTALNGNLPMIEALKDQETHKAGWYGEHCVYFDALEADDLFIYPKEVSDEGIHTGN